MRRERGCVLSVIQAGFPLGEKEGDMGGWEKRGERERREDKRKQRVRDSRGEGENQGQHVSVRMRKDG